MAQRQGMSAAQWHAITVVVRPRFVWGRGDTTLLVSLDLQAYIGMDDDAAAAMRRTVAARWRSAWSAAHPGVHATLHVRFIDFIGRKIAELTVHT